MSAIEVITGTVTAVDVLTPVTVAAGNSLTIRAFSPPERAFIVSAWASATSSGTNDQGSFRIRSEKMHDAENGIRMTARTGDISVLFPIEFSQEVFSRDTLIVELAGSAGLGVISTGSFLMYYTNIQGVHANLIDSKEFKKRYSGNLFFHQVILNSGASGGYSGEETLIADRDRFKANTYYALLGITTSNVAAIATIRIRGKDTGNLGIGIPNGRADFTSNFFIRLSDALHLSAIPVFDSENRRTTLIDCAGDEGSTVVRVTFIFAELENYRKSPQGLFRRK